MTPSSEGHELLLGITTLSAGGTTAVPRQVMELLKLKLTLERREKILWTQEGDEVIVTKGTPRSSYEKTMLRRGGRTAIPRHIRKVLKLRTTLQREERIAWIRRGNEIVVRKAPPQAGPTD